MFKKISLSLLSTIAFCLLSYSQTSVLCFKSNELFISNPNSNEFSKPVPSDAIYIINVPKMQILIISDELQVWTISESRLKSTTIYNETYQYTGRSQIGASFLITYVRAKDKKRGSRIIQSNEGVQFTIVLDGQELSQ